MIILKNKKLLALSLATSILLSNVQTALAEVVVDESFKDVGVTILEERHENESSTKDKVLDRGSDVALEKRDENSLKALDKDEKENTLMEDGNIVNDESEGSLLNYKDRSSALDTSDNILTDNKDADLLEFGDGFKPEETSVKASQDNFIYKDSTKRIIIGYKGRATGDLVIPSDVVEIGPGAFAATPSRGAFTGRLDLSNARDLQVIGIGAFAGNKFTGDLRINAYNLESISDYAFYGNEFDNIDLTNTGVTHIGKAAFAHSAGPNAGRIDLPNDIKSIDDDAFTGEETRGSLTLTKFDENSGRVVGSETLSLDRNRESASYGYSYLGISENQESLESIGSNAFSYNKLNDRLILPLNLKTIGSNAFTRNYFAGDLEFIDSRIESIGDNAFYSAYANGYNLTLKNLRNLNYLGKGAFQNNAFDGNLTLDTIPNLREINDFAFFASKDSQGNEHYFKGKLTLNNLSGLERIGQKAFSYETELDPTLARNLDEVRAYNQKSGHVNGFTELAMSNLPRLKTIDAQAFMDNNFGNSMDFSQFKNLEVIENQAFSNAGFSGLLDFKNMTNLKYFGESAFFNTGAENVDFSGSGINEIKKLAFSGAKIGGDLKIEKLSNLTNIGEAAFQSAGAENSVGDISIKDNPKLQNIGFRAFNKYANTGNVFISGNRNLAKIEQHAFSQNYDEAIDGTNETTKGAKLGPKLVISNNGLKEIGDFAFYNNTFKGILKLSGNPLQKIGNGAFAYNGFICIELPNTVEATGGMQPGSDFSAFALNNQNFKGTVDNDAYSPAYFDLPIYVKDGQGISKLVSDEDGGEYKINFTSPCQELSMVNIKIVDEDTGELIENTGTQITLMKDIEKTPKGNYGGHTVAGTVEGQNKVSFEDVNLVGDKVYAYIQGIDPNKYDIRPVEKPIELPAPVDGVSELVVKLPKSKATLTINFLIEGTNEKVPGIKNNPLEAEGSIGQAFDLSKQPHVAENLKSIKDNFGYEMVPGQNTKIVLEKGSNVLNIYFRSTGKTINLVKRDEGDPNKLMPCIKYGLYNKAEYDKAVQIKDVAARQQAIAKSLIETKTTDENGKLSFTNVNVDVRIVELGPDTGCAKCGKDQSSACDYDKYIPNKKITEIKITDFPDGGNIDYTGNVVTIVVPHTGTRGLLPYALAFTVMTGLGFTLMRKKGTKRG